MHVCVAVSHSQKRRRLWVHSAYGNVALQLPDIVHFWRRYMLHIMTVGLPLCVTEVQGKLLSPGLVNAEDGNLVLQVAESSASLSSTAAAHSFRVTYVLLTHTLNIIWKDQITKCNCLTCTSISLQVSPFVSYPSPS